MHPKMTEEIKDGDKPHNSHHRKQYHHIKGGEGSSNDQVFGFQLVGFGTHIFPPRFSSQQLAIANRRSK